jgi:hypothetical protein
MKWAWGVVKDYSFGLACAINYIVYIELIRHWTGVSN